MYVCMFYYRNALKVGEKQVSVRILPPKQWRFAKTQAEIDAERKSGRFSGSGEERNVNAELPRKKHPKTVKDKKLFSFIPTYTHIHTQTHTHTYTHIQTHTHIYIEIIFILLT